MGNAGMGNAGIAVSAASAVNAGTAPLADNGLGRFTSPLTRLFVLVVVVLIVLESGRAE